MILNPKKIDGPLKICTLDNLQFTPIDKSPLPRNSVGICQMYEVDHRKKGISRSEGTPKRPEIESFWELN